MTPMTGPPLFTGLPKEIELTVLSFFGTSEVASMLQVSRDARLTVASTIHTLKLPYHALYSKNRDPQALISLLRLATELRHIDAEMSSNDGGTALVAAIGDGSVGGQLRSLKTSAMEDIDKAQLINHFKAGRMPHLTELGILGYNGGPARAEALEVRVMERGLPPITRLLGLRSLSPDVLRRVWRCCPPYEVTYLEANGMEQLGALGEYMSAHSGLFIALRSLVLSEIGGAGLDAVLEVLRQGHTPALEELTLSGWSQDDGTLGPLGHAMRHGALPRLSSLDLHIHGLRSNDHRTIVDGLRELRPGLRQLTLGGSHAVAEADSQYVAAAFHVKEGAFARLEKLKLNFWSGSWDPVVTALASGAPCARTLRCLALNSYALSPPARSALFLAMGQDAFPSLTSLTLNDFEGFNVELVHELTLALLCLATRGTPSQLQELSLGYEALEIGVLDLLTPVFQAGGLPCLERLSISGQNKEDMEAAFPDEWIALGPAIKLKRLDLRTNGLSPTLKLRLLEAFSSPSFCPFLHEMRHVPGPLTREDVTTRLEDRRRRREAEAGTSVGSVGAAVV